MLIINKNGNGLTILKEENGINILTTPKIAAISDRNLDKIESDASVSAGGKTSKSKLTFYDGQKFTYMWVEEQLSEMQLGSYTGSQAGLVITSVTAIAGIDVDNTTVIGSVPLPAYAEATVSNGVKVHFPITWDDGTPDYDGATAGEYVFSGTLTMPTGITNPNSIKASVTVTVGTVE